jgi:DNA-binding transcriptional LysR family regulator
LTIAKIRVGCAHRVTRKDVQAKLLYRSQHRVSLTDTGQRFPDRMRDVVARMQQAVDEVAGDDTDRISASLRIAAPMTFGTAYLGPLLFPFTHQHPDLALTLELEDRRIDILSSGHDLAVRVGRLVDSSLLARRIASSRRV